ncbi:MAG: uracil-DNA glycosylase [Gammaproteobacteria bacterium]|nr:uracil-DNA glycosylase [Gammaproteobacteria bacterium]MYF01615.1 uracil-DNA glycosylase [Gammaproteobacteria bacterium]MYI76518.1 uracil-DNA glycosylase [Gammaproteobacteria bacterium]
MTETKERIRLHPSWKSVLTEDLQAPYMARLRTFLQSELRAGKRIYPPMGEIFSALDYCPLDQVRVVIIGQDPYHGESQAHGLSFSVKPGVRPPPSLRNIFQEIQDDMHASSTSNQEFPMNRGCLTSWAAQGVLLLNSVLTVVAGRSGSHQGYGWEQFTDQIVKVVNEQREHVVFLLWGSPAQRKGEIVDRNRHYVLSAPHPSPLSADRGFFGCRHFSKTNSYLQSHGYEPIDWFRVE